MFCAVIQCDISIVKTHLVGVQMKTKFIVSEFCTNEMMEFIFSFHSRSQTLLLGSLNDLDSTDLNDCSLQLDVRSYQGSFGWRGGRCLSCCYSLIFKINFQFSSKFVLFGHVTYVSIQQQSSCFNLATKSLKFFLQNPKILQKKKRTLRFHAVSCLLLRNVKRVRSKNIDKVTTKLGFCWSHSTMLN